MNAELQNLRSHYDGLSDKVKARMTAQSLLRAIQIAEQYEEALKPFTACEVSSCGTPDDGAFLWKPTQTGRNLPGISIADIKRAQAAIAHVAKKEGE